MKKTKKAYEEKLNKYTYEEFELVWGDDRPSKRVKKYGTWLRKNDPLLFLVGYNTWQMRKEEW